MSLTGLPFGCQPDPNTGDINCTLRAGNTCPDGYTFDHYIDFPVNSGIHVAYACKPIPTPPDPNALPDAVDIANCNNTGLALLGPSQMGLWNNTDQKSSKGFAASIVSGKCSSTGTIPWTKTGIDHTWDGTVNWMQNKFLPLAINKQTCVQNNFRGSTDTDYPDPITYLDMINPTVGKMADVATGCGNCAQYPDECPISPTPLNPVTPLYPLHDPPSTPLQCPPDQPTCNVTDLQFPKAFAELQTPFNGLPFFAKTTTPYNPKPQPPPWWAYWEEDILADLAYLALTPEYVAGVLGATIPIYALTNNWSRTLGMAAIALAAPFCILQFRYAMQWVRNEYRKFMMVYQEFKQYEYPVMFLILGESALAGIMAVEEYFGLPFVFIGETGLYGTLVVLAGAAITWFINTDAGKAITGAGSYILKGIDCICDPENC
jgi:hypothetical protein